MSTLSLLNKKSVLVRLVFVIALAIVPLVTDSQFVLNVMLIAGLYSILAVGLGLLLGQAGQISLGQAAFFGIGAFTSAILTTKLHWPAFIAMIAGAVLAGMVAYIVGKPILRLKSYFLAIATMGFGQIFMVLARETRGLTGGNSGIVSIPWFNIGNFIFNNYFKQYYLVWGVALVMLFLTERALASRVGRTLRALAVSEVAASTLGIHTADWKMRSFVLSAVYAGIGGGLYAFTMTTITFSNFDSSLSMMVMIMIIVGGISSLFGGVIGVILISWLGHAFSGYVQFSGSLLQR